MPKFSIIIPVCNNLEITQKCVESIEKYSSDYELIIIDNGSAPAYAGAGRIVRSVSNLGFPVAVNQGIREAAGNIIVILNNDTIVTPHWLERLKKHLETYDIVGPITNLISGPQQVDIFATNPAMSLSDAVELNSITNKGRIWPWHRLVFFCVAMKKEVVAKIGLLDEQFSPGNFEDDDYCLRALEAGFKLGIAYDVFISHLGSATHKSLGLDHRKLLETNFAKFQAKWPEARQKEIQQKSNVRALNLGQQKRPTLALVMIVKNEEKGLDDAIRSCVGFVDEVVIAVDNASTDRTEEIAKKFATTLKHFDWQDDFAAARNYAHEGVKSDWILFLDGHEFVKSHDKLEEYLKSDADGLLCAVEMENGVIFRNPRIYRNGAKFGGAVHEMQDCSRLKHYPEFVVVHNRLGAQSVEAQTERKKQRDDMVPRLMGEMYKKNKKNSRASFHLALHAQTAGKPKEAIKWFKRYLKFSKVAGTRWYAYFQIALMQIERKNFFRAFWAANRADFETPGRWEIQKLKGLIWFGKGRYTEALKCLTNTFYQNTGDVSFKPMKRDDSGTWNLCGECFFNLGLYDKAHIAFTTAAERTEDKIAKEILSKRAALMAEMLKN